MQLLFFGEGAQFVAFGEGTEVVLRSHCFAIGAGGADGEQVTTLKTGQTNVVVEDVAGLADGSYHIVGLQLFGCKEGEFLAELELVAGADALDLVVCSVEGRTDEFGHAGIDDGELAVGALFDVEHTGDEAAALCHDGASQFEMDALSWSLTQVGVEGGEVVAEVRNGVDIGIVVIYTQSASYVDVVEGDAFTLQEVLNLVDAEGEVAEVVHLEDLAADVEVESAQADMLHALGNAYDTEGVFEGDAELVFCQSCGDVGMGVSTHVGIDAEADAGSFAHAACEFVDDFEFGYALDVEAIDVVVEGGTDFPVALADACEDDLGGGESCLDGCFYLAAADAVDAQSCPVDKSQEHGVGIGLDGVMHFVVRVFLYLTIQDLERALKQLGVVEVIGGLSCLHNSYLLRRHPSIYSGTTVEHTKGLIEKMVAEGLEGTFLVVCGDEERDVVVAASVGDHADGYLVECLGDT